MPRKAATTANTNQEPTDAADPKPEDVTPEQAPDAGQAAGAGDWASGGGDTGEGPAASGEAAAQPEPVKPPRHAPTQETSGRVLDTTTSDTIPPGSVQDRREHETTGDSDYHVLRLADYLREHFPHQMEITRQYAEHPVDTAIRLLAGFSSHAPAVTEHCKEPYCNKPAGHADEHGWIN